MTKPERDTVISSLRQWLQNERRLGIPHWPLRRPASQNSSAAEDIPAAVSRERSRAPAGASTLSMFTDDPELPPVCTAELAEDAATEALARLETDFVKTCTRCELHRNRSQTVFGVGSARPRIVFVGEGPGAEEDRQGIPFVGRAGQLLTRMIAAMTLTRDQVYICNVVKCRPPGNRTPSEPEMRVCAPFLYRQLAILRPTVIIALGRPAAQTLLDTKVPIGKLRGRFHDFPPPALQQLGLPPAKLMPTFHPAYLLRSPGEKPRAWEDLKQVMGSLGIPIPARP